MNNAENELKLAKFLLEKYDSIINEREQRTIGEIKELVSGKDLSVLSLIEEFKGNSYSFEENYESTLKNVFEYITKEIDHVEVDLNINYWLTPKEILDIKVADDEDLAVFLCSAMRALGDEQAEVIIAELDNLKTHAFVATQIKDKFLILDPSQEQKFEDYYGKKPDIIGKYSFQKQKIKRFLYRFNFAKYEQFLE